jgi:hypothetical protein
MLTSVLGIRLMVLTGETIPLPASQDVLSAIRRVEVTNQDSDQGDGFQITFSLTKTKTGEYSLVEGGTLDPDRRVVIGVLFGVTPEVLIDGVITHHQLIPGDKPGAATLTVSGRDISALMDLEEVNEAFTCQPDSVIVTGLLARYARYGIVPRVTPTADVPLPTSRIPRQCETDLRFVRRLAARNNFVFYLEPVAPGASTAYWGAENRAGLPQAVLSVNMGADTNVKDIDLANDELAPVGTKGVFVEPVTKMSISIPPLPELRVPPLAARTGMPRRTRLMRTTGNRDPVQALLAALAEAGQAEEPVRSNCVVDAARYGHALRARRTVGLRGVGRTYDGLYYVKRVTHKIEPGSYTQSLMLTREGTGSISPVLST